MRHEDQLVHHAQEQNDRPEEKTSRYEIVQNCKTVYKLTTNKVDIKAQQNHISSSEIKSNYKTSVKNGGIISQSLS